MDRALAIAIANAAKYLAVALDEIRAMVDADQRGLALQELLRHVREMIDVLSDAVQRLGDVPEAPVALDMAARLSGQLELLERDIAGRPLH